MHTCIANASNGIVEITISEPGTLKEKVLDVDVDLIESLKVSGILNASDLEFLGTSTGLVANIKTLDIRDVKFVLDGQVYRQRVYESYSMGSVSIDHYALWPCDSTSRYVGVSESITTYYGNNLAGAFYQCKYEKVLLPTSIDGVGYCAFEKSENLKEVIFGGKEKYISSNSFRSAKNLSNIIIPESIDSISEGAFMEAGNGFHIDLSNIKVLGEQCFKKSGISSVILPSTINSLPEEVFYNCKQLTEVSIPEGIKTIEKCAFLSCENLKSVTLNNSLVEIGQSAFSSCPIKDIMFPESLKTISFDAFRGCDFTEILLPDGVEEIGSGAFECKNLEKINVPKKLKKIDHEAFKGSKLESTFPIENYISYFGTAAYSYKHPTDAPKDFVLTNVTFRPNTTILADNLFHTRISYNNYTKYAEEFIESVELPLSLKYIGAGIFNNTKIKEISLPEGLEEIGAEAFRNTPLSSIKLPSTLKKIGEYAFTRGDHVGDEKNVLLTSVDFPEGLEEIGYRAFAYQPLTTVRLPQSLKILGRESFGYNKNLVRIIYNCIDAKVNIGSPFNDSSCDRITIGEKVESIPDYLFDSVDNNFNISKLEFPNNLKYIGNYSFYKFATLEQVNLPEGLEFIGEYAFEGTKLMQVDFPKSLKYIGANAFYGTLLDNIVLSENIEFIGSGAFSAIPVIIDKIIYNCPNAKSAGEDWYPDGFIGRPFAQSYCNELIIGPSVKSIPAYFFYKLGGYSELVIPEGCEFGKGAFRENTSLASVTLPEGLKCIPERAFYRCTSLYSINMPNSVETIGYRAFTGCQNLTGMELPIMLQEIGEFACGDVSFDNEINLGPNVKKIGKYAFSGCTNVGRIFIPSQVESIGEKAFNIYTDYSSDPVQVISMIEDPASVTGGMYEIFPDEYNKWKLRMPCGTEELYRSTPGWFGFGEYAVNDDLTINLTDGFETQFDNLSSVDLCGVIRDNIYYSLNYSGDMSNLYLVGNKTVDDKLFDFLTPYNYDLTQLFDGIAVQLPAGEGYLTLEYSNSGGSTLTVKVASQDPVIFDNQNLSTNNVKFNTSEETFAYIYSNGDNSWSNVYSLKVSTNVSGVEDVIEGADEYVLQRLTVDGMPASVDSKGIVIEKLSNGQVRKVMRK